MTKCTSCAKEVEPTWGILKKDEFFCLHCALMATPRPRKVSYAGAEK